VHLQADCSNTVCCTFWVGSVCQHCSYRGAVTLPSFSLLSKAISCSFSGLRYVSLRLLKVKRSVLRPDVHLHGCRNFHIFTVNNISFCGRGRGGGGWNSLLVIVDLQHCCLYVRHYFGRKTPCKWRRSPLLKGILKKNNSRQIHFFIRKIYYSSIEATCSSSNVMFSRVSKSDN
jgi:hypothetical protein